MHPSIDHLETITSAFPGSNTGRSTLLLFDIDGTLLTTGGAGERALRLAFRDYAGIDDDFSGIEIAGRTDSGIARQLFEKHRLEATHANLAEFLDAYIAHLQPEIARSPGRLLPGVTELLERLQSIPQVSLALLTGNLARGAELKLSHYGIWRYFEFGAFADDHHDRNQLGPCALRRGFEKHGVEFVSERSFVIGDTAHDIACGRAFGARTIAVATGRFTAAELAAASPDYLFENLADTGAVIAAIGLQEAGRSLCR